MTTIFKFDTAATDVEQANPIARGYYNTVALGSGADGTITAGTITFECKAPGAAEFETPSVSTIDLSSPTRIQIEGKIEAYKISITGFAGTATEVPIVFDSYGSGQN